MFTEGARHGAFAGERHVGQTVLDRVCATHIGESRVLTLPRLPTPVHRRGVPLDVATALTDLEPACRCLVARRRALTAPRKTGEGAGSRCTFMPTPCNAEIRHASSYVCPTGGRRHRLRSTIREALQSSFAVGSWEEAAEAKTSSRARRFRTRSLRPGRLMRSVTQVHRSSHPPPSTPARCHRARELPEPSGSRCVDCRREEGFTLVPRRSSTR